MQQMQWGVTIGAALVAASIDIRMHRIPNALTGPVLLLGLIWAGAVGQWGGLVDGLGGIAVAGLPFVVMWMMNAGGAGDAKMMMALGAWLGVRNGAAALVGVALAGGLVSIGYAMAQRRLRVAVVNVVMVVWATVLLSLTGRRPLAQRELIPSIRGPQAFPYGLAIFIGTSAAAIGMWAWRQ